MIKKHLYLLFTSPRSCFFSLVLLATSCNIINPAEQIPAYLQIDSVVLTTDDASQGSASQKISDVWVDANDEHQGVYEIPKTFPVLNNGSTYFIFSGGILDNGIGATRVIYPFYFPDTVTVNLSEKEIYPITPHFVYRSVTKFRFIENFEAGNLFDKTGGDTDIVRVNDANVFEGNYSGYIFLDQNHKAFAGRSHDSYTFPANEPVYLEMNYKCDQVFQIGLSTTTSSGIISYYKWNINKQDDWNKIYLNLGEDVKTLNGTDYQILIQAILDSANQNESHIYFDNIKLVSY